MKADKKSKASGFACINLTPEIKKAMKEMLSVQVIEVFPAQFNGNFKLVSMFGLY